MIENEYTQKAIDSYIEGLKRATRFELENVKILQSKTTVTKSRFFTTFVLDTRYFTNVVEGRVSLQSYDTLIHNDEYAYKQACHNAVENEHNRKETYHEVITKFSTAPFASWGNKTDILIRTDPNRVLHQYTCPQCHGNGKLTCGKCYGRGTVTCTKCGGSVKRQCFTCGGRGVIETTVADYRPNAPKSWRTEIVRCNPCNGSGDVRCSCGDGKERCNNCGGSGEVRCPTCKGHGELTQIYELQTFAIPTNSAEYTPEAPSFLPELVENKIGFQDFINHGSVKLIQTNTNTSNRSVLFEFEAELYVAELEVQIDALKTTAIIYGRNFAIFDAGGVLGKLLDDDLQNLENLLEEKALFSWQYQTLLHKPVSLFMESEVNQQMVDGINTTKELNSVFENLGRSLSKEYIESASLSLKMLVTRLITRVNIEGAVLVSLLTALVLVIVLMMGIAQENPIEIFGITLINETYTYGLYVLGALVLGAEWLYLKRSLTLMGQKWLYQFAYNAYGKFLYLNVAAVFLLISILNYTASTMAYSIDFRLFESNENENITASAPELPNNSEVQTDLGNSNPPTVDNQSSSSSAESEYVTLEKNLVLAGGRCAKKDKAGCDEYAVLSKKSEIPFFMDGTAADNQVLKEFYEDECMKNDNAVACYRAGIAFKTAFMFGSRDVRDKEKALQYFQKACNQGDTMGCKYYDELKKTGK